jgi:hypothetical protein
MNAGKGELVFSIDVSGGDLNVYSIDRGIIGVCNGDVGYDFLMGLGAIDLIAGSSDDGSDIVIWGTIVGCLGIKTHRPGFIQYEDCYKLDKKTCIHSTKVGFFVGLRMLKNNVRKENIAFEEGMGSGFVWFEKF